MFTITVSVYTYTANVCVYAEHGPGYAYEERTATFVAEGGNTPHPRIDHFGPLPHRFVSEPVLKKTRSIEIYSKENFIRLKNALNARYDDDGEARKIVKEILGSGELFYAISLLGSATADDSEYMETVRQSEEQRLASRVSNGTASVLDMLPYWAVYVKYTRKSDWFCCDSNGDRRKDLKWLNPPKKEWQAYEGMLSLHVEDLKAGRPNFYTLLQTDKEAEENFRLDREERERRANRDLYKDGSFVPERPFEDNLLLRDQEKILRAMDGSQALFCDGMRALTVRGFVDPWRIVRRGRFEDWHYDGAIPGSIYDMEPGKSRDICLSRLDALSVRTLMAATRKESDERLRLLLGEEKESPDLLKRIAQELGLFQFREVPVDGEGYARYVRHWVNWAVKEYGSDGYRSGRLEHFAELLEQRVNPPPKEKVLCVVKSVIGCGDINIAAPLGNVTAPADLLLAIAHGLATGGSFWSWWLQSPRSRQKNEWVIPTPASMEEVRAANAKALADDPQGPASETQVEDDTTTWRSPHYTDEFVSITVRSGEDTGRIEWGTDSKNSPSFFIGSILAILPGATDDGTLCQVMEAQDARWYRQVATVFAAKDAGEGGMIIVMDDDGITEVDGNCSLCWEKEQYLNLGYTPRRSFTREGEERRFAKWPRRYEVEAGVSIAKPFPWKRMGK